MQRTGNRLDEEYFAYLLGRLYRLRDDEAGAESLLHEALAITAGQVLPDEVLVRTQLFLLYGQLRQPEPVAAHLGRCREILDKGEDWRGLVGRVALAQAVVCALEGCYAEAEQAFERAVAVFRRLSLPWEEAEALCCWAQASRDAGQRAKAALWAGQAIASYRRRGAGERWVERVQRLVAQPAGSARATVYPNGLSAREIEVLRLVAAGKSNREVAQALMISVNTVLQHMRSIFNKTGANTRTQAADFAHRHDITEPERP